MKSLDDLMKKESPSDIENHVQEMLKRLLEEIQAPVSSEDLWLNFKGSTVVQELLRHWPEWTADDRERHWETLCRDMEKTAYGTRPYCLRCGECCRKGSPTLYKDDLGILRRGIIHRMDLMTLRPGEIGFSNATNDLVLLTEERIKIKEKIGSRECLLFDPENNTCRIYENRPEQCQAMECWNPEFYSSLDSHSFLTRRDLLNPDDPLVPVIEAHDKHCALFKLQGALSKIKMDARVAQEEAMELLQYDLHLRELLEEKQGIGPESLVFLFGRALVDLIHSFGFGFKKKADGVTILVPLSANSE